MSSLLLCALVAFLPQAFGKQTERASNTNIRFNNSILLGQKANHKLLLNLNAPPLVAKTNELQSVFADQKCSICFDCMDRAVKARGPRYNKYSIDSEELHSDLLSNTITVYRNKRYVTSTSSTETKKEKKGKKKSKGHKTIIVTKYNVDGEVYALKVRESVQGVEVADETCQVYSVNKVMPCASPEGQSILTNAKRNVKDKSHKDDDEKATRRVETTRAPLKSLFKKRQVDDTQMPENVMSSVEEFY